MTGGTTEFRLAPLAPGRWPEVAALGERCFSSPWSPDTVRRVLAEPQVLGCAAETDRRELLGYALGAVRAGLCHLLEVAVAPEARRQGIGGALVAACLRTAREEGARVAYLEVRAGNRGALSFYRSQGFRPAGCRTGYYPDTGEDALLLARGIDAADP